MRYFGGISGGREFWLFSVGVPSVFWLVLMVCRQTVYLLEGIHANAWDTRREEVILQETRRGRRALQILGVECFTAHSAMINAQFSASSQELFQGENKLSPQTSWQGHHHIRHSRLPVTPGQKSEDLLLNCFTEILKQIAPKISSLPPDNPVAILLEYTSTLSGEKIREVWRFAWQKSAIQQPVEFVKGKGVGFIDYWLDYRIKDNAVLLIIALQIAPEQPEMTTETVVALLLANRLTQKTLAPLTLLHRPEKSSAGDLERGVLQAGDWVPVFPDTLKHLWLTGLHGEGALNSITLPGKAPFVAITNASAIHRPDMTLGHAGCAAPWLAVAAAAQAAQLRDEAQMIISSEQGQGDIWSAVVAPCDIQQENVT
ncbi:hypothetical protein GJV06_15810 [Enterobacteriaceae bacterium RIT691]|nr:hypothetical protein [Enterobacteriaceae bacterium RIT691]